MLQILAISSLILSILLIAYTYAGYPICLRLIARLKGLRHVIPETLSDTDCPPAVFVLCVYNESLQVRDKIRNCLQQDYPPEKLRVLVVSDGSTDDTDMMVESYPSERVTLYRMPTRSGKAACLNEAMSRIEEDFIVLIDVRQRLSADAVRILLSHFRDPKVGAVSGELCLDAADSPATVPAMGQGISTYWRHEVELRKSEATVHSVVGATGALYAIRRAAFTDIPAGTILDDVLIPMNAVMAGYTVKFDTRARAHDELVSDRRIEQGRKVRTLAGNFQLLKLKPALLNPAKNPIVWQFVSHKILRLIVPLAMLVALTTSAILAEVHWVFAVVLGLQVLGYSLACLPDPALSFIGFRPARAIRVFLVMHWFVVLGFVEFLSNENAHLWSVSSQRQ